MYELWSWLTVVFVLSLHLFGPKRIPEIVRLRLNRSLCDSTTLKTILQFLFKKKNQIKIPLQFNQPVCNSVAFCGPWIQCYRVLTCKDDDIPSGTLQAAFKVCLSRRSTLSCLFLRNRWWISNLKKSLFWKLKSLFWNGMGRDLGFYVIYC